MESLQTDPRSRDWLTALGLNSCAAIVKFFAPAEPPLTTTVIVIPRTVQLPDKSTRAEQLTFLKAYGGDWRPLAREVLAYRKKRWPNE